MAETSPRLRPARVTTGGAILLAWSAGMIALGRLDAPPIVGVLAAIGLTVPLISFWEWMVHGVLYHRRLPGLDVIREIHTAGHHGALFPPKHYVQASAGFPFMRFRSPRRPWRMADNAVDNFLTSGSQVALHFVVGLPFITLPVYLLTGPSPFFWSSLGTLAVISWLLAYVHGCIHTPRDRAIERMGWFLWLDRHHYIHHIDQRANINFLLPLCDVLFGTLKRQLSESEARRFPSFEEAKPMAYDVLHPHEARGEARLIVLGVLLGALALGVAALWWVGRPRGVGQSGDLRLHPVAPDVWMFRGYFSNAFALILPQRVVLVDALISPETATLFRDALARVTDRPVTHLIWTHYNGDHVGGSSVFAGPGVEIICTAETARLVVERDDERRAYVEAFGLIAHDFPAVPAPTRTFTDALTLSLDGETLALRQLGAVETSDACVVWWPARRVVAVGDGVATAGYPYTGAPVADEGLRDDGAWIGFLQRVEDLGPTVLLPGHGPVLHGAEAIGRRLGLLRALMADVIAAAKAERAVGGPIAAIVDRAEARLAAYAAHPDLRQNVATQRFALYRALNSLDPARRGLGWWWDFRPSRLADPPAEAVEAALAACPTPAAARAAAPGLPPAVARAVLLARGADEPASLACLADAMLAAVTTTPSIVDAADYFREAARAAQAALAADARQADALRVLGVLEVWSALVLGQPMERGRTLLRQALDAGQSPGNRRKVMFFLGKSFQYTLDDARADACLRGALPGWLRPAWPLLRPRLRSVP